MVAPKGGDVNHAARRPTRAARKQVELDKHRTSAKKLKGTNAGSAPAGNADKPDNGAASHRRSRSRVESPAETASTSAGNGGRRSTRTTPDADDRAHKAKGRGHRRTADGDGGAGTRPSSKGSRVDKPTRLRPRAPSTSDGGDEDEEAGKDLRNLLALDEDVYDRDSDDDEDDEDELDEDYGSTRVKGQERSGPAVKAASELQSRRGRPRRGVYVPDWAMAVVSSDAQQKLLGLIDYWLGITTRGVYRGKPPLQLRARGRYLRVEDDGTAWYVVTCREIGWQIGKNKEQVRRLVRRLRGRGFLLVEHVARKDGSPAMAYRLAWERIERTFAEAAPPWERLEEDG
jgi:hypothetical protein